MTGPAPRAAGKRADPGYNQAQEERPFARSKAPWLALGVLGEKEHETRKPPHSRTAFPQSGAQALSFSYRRAAPKPPPPELRPARRAGSRAREAYLRFRPRPPRAASPPPFPLGLRRPGLWPHPPAAANQSEPPGEMRAQRPGQSRGARPRRHQHQPIGKGSPPLPGSGGRVEAGPAATWSTLCCSSRKRPWRILPAWSLRFTLRAERPGHSGSEVAPPQRVEKAFYSISP